MRLFIMLVPHMVKISMMEHLWPLCRFLCKVNHIHTLCNLIDNWYQTKSGRCTVLTQLSNCSFLTLFSVHKQHNCSRYGSIPTTTLGVAGPLESLSWWHAVATMMIRSPQSSPPPGRSSSPTAMMTDRMTPYSFLPHTPTWRRAAVVYDTGQPHL